MSIGATPKYIRDFQLGTLTDEHFLVIAVATAKQLEWRVTYISKSGLIAYTNKDSSSHKAKIEIRIANGIANLKSSSVGTEWHDKGRNEKVIDTFIEAFYAVDAATTTDEVTERYREMQESNAIEEHDILNTPPPPMERLTGAGGIFKPIPGYFVTPIIINLNIVLFVLMVASGVSIFLPDNEDLLRWGADFRPLTLTGQWWRPVTCMFLHIGVIHLVMNMFALTYIGLMLEPYLGKARFLSAYLLTGIIASITSLWWHEMTISAGASGAIFGMYGVFLALLNSSIIEKATRKNLLMSIGVFVAYNLLSGMKDGVDNAAHLGGLISGAAIGYAFVPSLKKPGEKRLEYVTILLLSALTIISAGVAYKCIPDNVARHEMIMMPFTDNEAMALKVLEGQEFATEEEVLDNLKNNGIDIWKKNLALLDSVSQMDLPDGMRHRDDLLRKYCQLRIRSYELIYKGLENNTDEYQDQIEEYVSEINAVVDSVNSL